MFQSDLFGCIGLGIFHVTSDTRLSCLSVCNIEKPYKASNVTFCLAIKKSILLVLSSMYSVWSHLHLQDHGNQPALVEMVIIVPSLPQQINHQPPPQDEPLVPAFEDCLVVLPMASSLDSKIAMDEYYLWSSTALVDNFVAEVKDMMPIGSALDTEL